MGSWLYQVVTNGDKAGFEVFSIHESWSLLQGRTKGGNQEEEEEEEGEGKGKEITRVELRRKIDSGKKEV